MKKTCTKCGVGYPATAKYFCRRGDRPAGLVSQCKKCDRERRSIWHKANKEMVHRRHKHWERNNRGKRSQINKRYRHSIKGYLGVVYRHLKFRCNDPTYKCYRRYGGRGIKNKFNSLDGFRDYVMNELGYDSYNKIKGLQIDRIDNNGHYEKGNIRFVTAKVNNNNKNRSYYESERKTGES